ncbi:MAG: phosphonoacetaldehyde hydrolase [Planctomycetales bacterium]|nr:phosphonoacetaldehyde hydrolase [Planctomycetales bacterium]
MSDAPNTAGAIKAVLFDWAGTTIDYGSLAPMRVFVEIFRRRGVEISIEEARGPMGRAKHDHIATVTRLPRVAAKWRSLYGHTASEADVLAMYEEFLPLQRAILSEGWDVIPGVVEAVAELRSCGIRIGSTTGYTRSLMEVVAPRAADLGYAPDCLICADDVAAGRPAPWMNFRAAEMLGIFPPSAIVAVDDTPVGIEAAINAGMWAVGVARTGNELGLSKLEADDFERSQPNEFHRKLTAARNKLLSAGAHHVVDGVEDLLPIMAELGG